MCAHRRIAPDWFQMVVDDLPVWGMVGELPAEETKGLHDPKLHGKMRLFTHRSFSIGYNGERVVEVNVTGQNPVDVASKTRLEFTYDVRWVPSDLAFYQVRVCFMRASSGPAFSSPSHLSWMS